MSKLKCRPGDIVRVATAKSDARNEGILLRIIELDAEKTVNSGEVIWRVDGWYYGCADDPAYRWAADDQVEIVEVA